MHCIRRLIARANESKVKKAQPYSEGCFQVFSNHILGPIVRQTYQHANHPMRELRNDPLLR